MSSIHPPFFGKKIIRNEEKELIEKILEEYKGCKADEQLQKQVWERLQQEKFSGKIHTPFVVDYIKGNPPHIPSYIEIKLETKL